MVDGRRRKREEEEAEEKENAPSSSVGCSNLVAKLENAIRGNMSLPFPFASSGEYAAR